jgi:putative hemolysin
MRTQSWLGLASLLVLLLPVAAFSAESTQTFNLNDKVVRFTLMPERHITISSDCVAGGGKLKSCDASKAIEKADLSKMQKDPLGRNPGAMICSEQVGGTVVWSRDAKGNERTFCQFKDGSLVGSGTLSYYGRKKAASQQSK